MIVDLIIDRELYAERNGKDKYSAYLFYRECLEYNSIFDGIADRITMAMDYGEEEDVKKELCNYIIKSGYNENICDYINSVNWLD